MRLLSEHTTTTAREALADAKVAVLPTGSTEQHGPALPLGTDFLAAEALAETTTDREDTILLPTVPVGVSAHHRQFDGTLWTAPETFERYVTDIVTSVASHGVETCVVVNGHGGNSDALSRAARSLRRDDVAFVVPWNWWDGVSEEIEELFDGFPGHADEVESSMMFAVAPDLVREDALADAEADGADAWGREVHGASVGFDAADFTESGAVGRPTRASMGAGEDLFAAARRELHALVDWIAEQDPDDRRVRDHR